MRLTTRIHLLITACALVACATPPPITPDDAVDKLRDQMAHAPDDPGRGSQMEELARLELERAKQANTILAYRRYLEEFPLGDEAQTARDLLEALRFEQARKANSRIGWEVYIEENPHGAHLVDARLALGAIEIDTALASSDILLVRSTLGRFPDHPRHDALAAHEDDLAWAAAEKGGNEAIDFYLASHASGSHRLDALRAREQNQERAIDDSDDFEGARTLAGRADATEERRALAARIELRRIEQSLDLAALRSFATRTSLEPAVSAVYERARALVESLRLHPLSEGVSKAVAEAGPSASLPSHDSIVAAIDSGDPIERVGALRELAEWASPSDVKTVLAALDSEYVSVRLQAVETLRAIAHSLKPAVWHRIEHARETEALGHELKATTWRQIAALREADGRPEEAASAWVSAVDLDGADLASRARVFALAREAHDRLTLASAARDLAKAAIDFADGRWTPPKAADVDHPEGKGRIVGIPGSQTVLRQICSALDLGGDATEVLGELAAEAPPQEQTLLALARTDAEHALDRIRSRREELEENLRQQAPHFAPCGADTSAAAIAASRRLRAQALVRLGEQGDARVLPLVEVYTYLNAPELKAAAMRAAESLRSHPTPVPDRPVASQPSAIR
jgi:hypothetical protein